MADGPLAGFSLTQNKDSVSLGETFTVNLTNVTNEEQSSGNKLKYDIQRQTENGWKTIFWQSQTAITDEAILHTPDEGFTWNLTMTHDGLALEDDPFHYVCDNLLTGDYRFVYWGITSKQERESNYETEYALNTQFTVR